MSKKLRVPEKRTCIDCPNTFIAYLDDAVRCLPCRKLYANVLYRARHRDRINRRQRERRANEKNRLSTEERFAELTDSKAHAEPYPWVPLLAWILAPEYEVSDTDLLFNLRSMEVNQ